MTREQMIDNIKKVFGVNHSYTYQIESLVRVYPTERVKFVYNQMIDGEKDYIQKQIKKLQKRLDELNEM